MRLRLFTGARIAEAETATGEHGAADLRHDAVRQILRRPTPGEQVALRLDEQPARRIVERGSLRLGQRVDDLAHGRGELTSEPEGAITSPGGEEGERLVVIQSGQFGAEPRKE